MVPICMVPVGYYFYRAHVSVFNYFLCPLNTHTHTHTHTHTQSVWSLWRVRAGGGHKFLFAMFFVSAGTSVCVCVCVCVCAETLRLLWRMGGEISWWRLCAGQLQQLYVNRRHMVTYCPPQTARTHPTDICCSRFQPFHLLLITFFLTYRPVYYFLTVLGLRD